MAITPLPTPPSRSQSPATFSTDADAFLGALPDFATEANALATDVNADEASAAASATTASNAASVAVGAANYMGDYNAGTTYQIGKSVSYNGRRYVAKTVNTGVTPVDGANWFLINDGDVLGPVSATSNALALYDGTSGKLIKNGPAPGTAGNIIVSNGTTWASQAFPAVSGSVTATATGSIGNGNFVVLNSDGTVSIVSGTRPGAGSPVSVSNMQRPTVAYDSTNQRVLLVYTISDSSLRCRVGTVSGTVISFSAETLLDSNPINNNTVSRPVVVYNSSRNCFLIVYRNSPAASAYYIVARLSGSTLTFGSASGTGVGASFGFEMRFPAMASARTTVGLVGVMFHNGVNDQLRAVGINLPASGFSITIVDSTIKTLSPYSGYVAPQQRQFAITSIEGSPSGLSWMLYQTNLDGNQSGYWTASLNFGTQTAQVNTTIGTGTYPNADLHYLPAINRCVLTGSSPSSGFSILINPSGPTAVQFVYFEGSNTALDLTSVFDEAANKIITFYRDNGTSSFLVTVPLAITTTTITAGAKTTVVSASTDYMASAYDSQQQKTIVAYNGASLVLNSVTSTNMTAFNVIGAANGAYTNGQTATIQTIGAVNTGQAGLTPGSPRYIWADGTLNSIADPLLAFTVLAGTALTTTSIIVKA